MNITIRRTTRARLAEYTAELMLARKKRVSCDDAIDALLNERSKRGKR